MICNSQHWRAWQRSILVGLLSCLLAVPAGSVSSSTSRVMLPVLPQPTEEESQPRQTPTEEESQSVSCPVSREDWLERQHPPAMVPLLVHHSTAGELGTLCFPRPAELSSRNGCGGPLRC
ncbi:MAG TPA: hypothetical protein VFB80_10330 [Pirellulaceae bacterium]|nr:hypothetical protein [Pirellulaceae bacterium]